MSFLEWYHNLTFHHFNEQSLGPKHKTSEHTTSFSEACSVCVKHINMVIKFKAASTFPTTSSFERNCDSLKFLMT